MSLDCPQPLHARMDTIRSSMQCGPVRHRVDPKTQVLRRGFDHRVQIRQTDFRLADVEGRQLSMPAVYAAIAQDAMRNEMIFNDVLTALDHGRCPIVLTERRDHLDFLEEKFGRIARNVVVLKGGMTQRARKEAEAMLNGASTGERLVLATVTEYNRRVSSNETCPVA